MRRNKMHVKRNTEVRYSHDSIPAKKRVMLSTRLSLELS
jgi:hypothetical protein